MFGFGKKKNKDAEVATPETKAPRPETMILGSPVKGEIIKLENLTDAVFSSGALGKGVGILPSEGKIFSPVDGKIATVTGTKHAIAVESEYGVEILIHIGMDTVQLEGKYFDVHVSEGDKVTKGQLLVTFDIDGIKSEGYSTETPVVITNTDNFNELTVVDKTSIDVKEDLITIK